MVSCDLWFIVICANYDDDLGSTKASSSKNAKWPRNARYVKNDAYDEYCYGVYDGVICV